LTVCLPAESIPVRITLLPLQVAVLVAREIDRYVRAPGTDAGGGSKHRRTTVKWPNDVLVDERKISGTLIESVIVQNGNRDREEGTSTWLLIGIGINVGSSPRLDPAKSPGKHGREATCLRDAAVLDERAPSLPSPVELGTALASQLADWALLGTDERRWPRQRAELEARVIDDWKEFATFGRSYELRGQTVEEEMSGSYVGERVTTLDVEPDGQLVVVDSSGLERRLVADYLF
jgi:BirA family biotin operon repressor/biotin-[acetyl-CoA-carboxylase] ligase